MTNRTGVRLAYNIKNLREAYIGENGSEVYAAQLTKKTIEFRQHEGTLSPQKILDWINVCVGVVEFSHVLSKSDMENLCREHINDALEAYSSLHGIFYCSWYP